MAVRELSSSPSFKSLYPRALAGGTVVPALRKVPGVGKRFGRGGELPEIELELPDVELDREHLLAYDRVCGFTLRAELPPTYLHVLAFPLAMRLMTDSSFPFPVLGLVHVANRIVQRRPVSTEERPTLSVHAEGLSDHKRGKQFELVAVGSVEGEEVWRSESTYLRRQGGGDSDGSDKKGDDPGPAASGSVWKIPGDTGRRYAAVSGDRNPIHMHPLSARLFGMPRPIAHGMWLKARCLAALEGPLPDAFAVEVGFKKPVFLPGRVTFKAHRGNEITEFAMHDAKGQKPHLTGQVEPRR